MGYAFISYSSKHQDTANATRDLFIKKGIDCWMAPYDIPAGSNYAGVINDAIENCACLVLLLTEASQDSVWVGKEVNLAVTYRKTIITAKLENIELNSSFKFYLNNSQIEAVKIIDENNPEMLKILRAVSALTENNEHAQIKESCASFEEEGFNGSSQIVSNTPNELINKTKKSYISENAIKNSRQNINIIPKNVVLTVWSPVNTDVYLNDKNHLVMKIDHNAGFDYKYNNINVAGEFELIFVSKGFEKIISFDASSIDDKLDYRLNAILSKKEIVLSYDRNEAIEQLKEEATAYAYEQLSEVGVAEDIQLLIEELNRLSSIESKDYHTNYLIAKCACSLGKLAVKFDMIEKIKCIVQVYENYEAKSSFGYMFEPIVKKIVDGRFLTEEVAHKPNRQISLTIKTFVSGQILMADSRKEIGCIDCREDEFEKTFCFNVGEDTFGVIFKSGDFEKTYYFDATTNKGKLYVDICSTLDFDEYKKMCNREAARLLLQTYPTSITGTYQLGHVGTEEDYNFLMARLEDDYSNSTLCHGENSERLWHCVLALDNLAFRYNRNDALPCLIDLLSIVEDEKIKENILNSVQTLNHLKSYTNKPYRIDLVINTHSKVNIFYESKSNWVATIDGTKPMDEQINRCFIRSATNKFTLIFCINNIEKRISFDASKNSHPYYAQRIDID